MTPSQGRGNGDNPFVQPLEAMQVGERGMPGAELGDRAVQPQHEPPFFHVRRCLPAWEELTNDVGLLMAIRDGVRLGMTAIPQRDRGYVRDEQLVQACLEEAVAKGAMRRLTDAEAAATETWTPLFVRPKVSGGHRLITDLRGLNSCFRTPRFRQDSWSTVVDVLASTRPRWGATMDMQDFFHHLQLHSSASRWMRMRTSDGKAYECTAMPFGLACSPYWAHRLAHPIVQQMRRRGATLIWYVDDVLVLGQTPEEVSGWVSELLSLLSKLGVQLNRRKSVLEPRQTVAFLGQELDLQRGAIRPQQRKLDECLSWLRRLRRTGGWTAANIACLAGKLGDLRKGATNLTDFNKPLMRIAGGLARQVGWRRPCPEKRAREQEELLAVLERELLAPVPVILAATTPNATLTTDASDYGWAGTLQTGRRSWTVAGTFNLHEVQKHITWKETRAVALALDALQAKIRHGWTLLIRSDATAAVCAWRSGSRVDPLAREVMPWRRWLAERGVATIVQHVPGIANISDAASRRHDNAVNEATIPGQLFHSLCQQLRVSPQLDAFACAKNAKCLAFWSLEHDAMKQDWRPWSGRLYLFPPPSLMWFVLHKLQREQVQALLIAPCWEAAAWWPVLQQWTLRRSQPFRLQELKWSCVAIVLNSARSSW